MTTINKNEIKVVCPICQKMAYIKNPSSDKRRRGHKLECGNCKIVISHKYCGDLYKLLLVANERNIKMKCCGNCDDELNQEASRVCEYCIRYEDNGDEGGHYQDNWKQKKIK